MQSRFFVSALTVGMLTLSACGGPSTPAPASATAVPATVAPAPVIPTESMSDTEAMTETMEMTDTESMTESMEMTETEAMTETMEMTETEAMSDTSSVDRPAWQLLPLTNAQTGETFTLADFAGKTVYVEPFATWCTNCRQQMGRVHEAQVNLGDDVVYLALSVETNVGNEALAQYAEQYGFNFVYAAMSPDLLRELVALHGQSITNPPATPHFIIRADGSTTELVTGIHDVEEVTALIQAAQS